MTGSEGLQTGTWERGVPIYEPGSSHPQGDGDGSGQAYVTANAENTDVDSGSTTLTSPVMNASLSSSVLTYYRWFYNGNPPNNPNDAFVVEVSDDDGETWLPLETVGPAGAETNGGWFWKEFPLSAVPGLEFNNQFRVRFTASDTGIQQDVEAGVDGVELLAFSCSMGCPADLSGDEIVGPEDLAMLFGAWGSNPGHPADFDGDGEVDASDLAFLLGGWDACL